MLLLRVGLKLFNQPTNQPINQLTNQPTNLPTNQPTLLLSPNLSAEILALCDSFSLSTREFFFDRSPRIFENILGLYRWLDVVVEQ